MNKGEMRVVEVLPNEAPDVEVWVGGGNVPMRQAVYDLRKGPVLLALEKDADRARAALAAVGEEE